MKRHGLSCDVMVAMSSPMPCRSVPAYRASPCASFRSGPFLPPPAARRGGTLFRAYPARARAGVGAGAVRAPDCARETEHAPSPSVPAGVSGPSRSLQKTEKAAPQATLPTPIIPHFPPGQAPWWVDSEIFLMKGQCVPTSYVRDITYPAAVALIATSAPTSTFAILLSSPASQRFPPVLFESFQSHLAIPDTALPCHLFEYAHGCALLLEPAVAAFSEYFQILPAPANRNQMRSRQVSFSCLLLLL